MSDASSSPTEDPVWKGIAAAATKHLVEVRSWAPGEFRLENRGRTRDGELAVVHAIHLDDERNPAPGGGRSLVLHIDPATRAVVRELGFQ